MYFCHCCKVDNIGGMVKVAIYFQYLVLKKSGKNFGINFAADGIFFLPSLILVKVFKAKTLMIYI